jgi:hypothetical protein
MNTRTATREDGASVIDEADAVPQSKFAFAFFVFAEAIALVSFGLAGRSLWFRYDEWEFLADRTAWNRDGLLADHGFVHPSMLPVLAYRFLWWMFGLRSYAPYVLLILALHLICAFLIRTVMLHAGVRPWIASIVAAAFVFFGSGYECIIWAFQIGYVGSLVFGFVHLLLCDHDGPLNKRDAFGLLAGLASLACSAVGITMVFAVAVSTLIRRGWRVSLVHAAPLAAIYIVWFELYASSDYANARRTGFIQPGTPVQTIRYFVHTFFHTLRALGQSTVVGVALGALLLSGLLLAWRGIASAEQRAMASMPIALAAAMVSYLVLTGYGRQSKLGSTSASRYLYVVAALLVPVLGFIANALVSRSRAVGVFALAAIVIGIPGNVHTLFDYVNTKRPTVSAFKNMMLTLPRVPLARELPATQEPNTGLLSRPGHVSAQWLLAGVKSGRIPKPSTDAVVTADATLRWAIQDNGVCLICGAANALPTKPGCTTSSGVTTIDVAKGSRIQITGANVVLSPTIGPLVGKYPLTVMPGRKTEVLTALAAITFRASSLRAASICVQPPTSAP